MLTHADVCCSMLTYADVCGLAGVIPERLHEANTIRHCALSLVGEPIIYPQINQFIRMLHAEGKRPERSSKAPLRLYKGSIKALLRLH